MQLSEHLKRLTRSPFEPRTTRLSKQIRLMIDNDFPFNDVTCYRIQATEDMPDQYVEKDQIGGFVPKDTTIGNNSWVNEGSFVGKNATIGTNSKIQYESHIGNNATIGDCVTVTNFIEIGDNVTIKNKAFIYSNAKIGNNVTIEENAVVGYGAEIADGMTIKANAIITNHAVVKQPSDYRLFENTWNHDSNPQDLLNDDWFTYNKSTNEWASNIWTGTSEELIERAYQESEKAGDYYKAHVKFVESLNQLYKKHGE